MAVSMAQALATLAGEGIVLTEEQTELVAAAQQNELVAEAVVIFERKLLDLEDETEAERAVNVEAWVERIFDLSRDMLQLDGEKAGGGSDKFARRETFKRGFAFETPEGTISVKLNSEL